MLLGLLFQSFHTKKRIRKDLSRPTVVTALCEGHETVVTPIFRESEGEGTQKRGLVIGLGATNGKPSYGLQMSKQINATKGGHDSDFSVVDI